MNWSTIRSWAKEHGYTTISELSKDPNNPNEYDYYWSKNDDPTITGLSISVSKLACDIYNSITNNMHIEHQKAYKDQMLKNVENEKRF